MSTKSTTSLFGGQMRDDERRFQELNQRLEADLARLRDTQGKRLAQVDKRIDDQLDKLGKLLRQEIQDRNGAVDDLESRLQQAARSARGEINKALEGSAATSPPATNASAKRWPTRRRTQRRASAKPSRRCRAPVRDSADLDRRGPRRFAARGRRPLPHQPLNIEQFAA